MKNITKGQKLLALKSGGRTNVEKIEPYGSLEAYKKSNGTVIFFWRYSLGSYNQRISIGIYDSSAPPKSINRTNIGFSIQAAIRQAEIEAKLHFDNIDNGGYSQLQIDKVEAKNQEIAIATEKQDQSLSKLMLCYCGYLEILGRKSHKEALSIFTVHVIRPWPKFANLPACDITAEMIADMMRHVHEQGHARTSNKLRSYLRAAYQVAKSAKTKASIPSSFKSFKIMNNPASDTEPDTGANKADKNPLSTEEMLIYWDCIKDLSGFKGAILRLHLLTGGLRIEQLMQMKTQSISEQTFTLFDIKGRPGGGPRPYTTPLPPLARLALFECRPVGDFAISTDGGVTHLAATTFSGWAKDASNGKIANFQAKRIRSGVETLLSKHRFSKDLRGRLQSHGISGVQDRHYDGHDYIDEKKEMLTVLQKIFENGLDSFRS